jgi:hypothetical protein
LRRYYFTLVLVARPKLVPLWLEAISSPVMTTFAEHQAAPNADAENESRTGMPGIPTWKGVYITVFIVFAVFVVAMWGFEIFFS